MSLVRSSWRGWASIIGGALINMTCGTIYSLGNMTPYIVSYIRQHGRESDLTYQVVIMCTSLLFAMVSIGISIGTAMEKNYGVSKTILCGSVIGWVGMVSSYWSISMSFYLFLFTYGCLFGLSSGWAYVPTVISGMKWFPKRRGLVSGFLLGFYGIGGMAFDFIQTLFINPHNLNPNDVEIVGEREEIYFAQDSVLNRTPSTFLLQAGLSAILQITGLLLQYDATDHQDTEMQSLLDNEEESSTAVSENMDDSVEKEMSSDIKMKSLVPKSQENSARNAPPLPSDISTSRRRGHKGTSSDKDHQGVVTGESLKRGFNGTAATSHQEGAVSGEGLESTTSHDPLWSGVSLSVNQAIRRPYIWQFIAMNAACTFTGVAFIGSYKAYGIGFIRDDIFLAGIGSLASICNSLGHFLIGLLIDHISIKVTSIVLSGIISSSVLLVSVTSLGGKVPFLIVVCSVFFSVGGMFCIQPVIAIRAYGEEHFAGNFILITMLGATVPNILGALVLFTQKFLAWTTMYITFGLVPGIGMCMNLKNQQGQDV